jgi:hypothetical protein
MRAGCVLLLTLLALGCGEARTSVRGKVTSNGQPLQYGHIFFEPADGGRGLDGGADIRDGEYTILQISPGPKRVRIKSQPTPKRVAGGVNEREHVEMVPPINPIPTNAEGNNREVQIVRGEQELDFDVNYELKKK